MTKKEVNFIFRACKNIIKNNLAIKCADYDLPFMKKIHHYENNRLMGLIIYFDNDKTRWILEGHYLGENNFVFYKNWRNLFRDDNIDCWKATVQKVNKRIVDFYLKMKFFITCEDDLNYYFEYRR